MILVFKTNIKKRQEQSVRKILSTLVGITKLDFDFEDCDNILRIESNTDLIKKVESILNSNNIYCKELI